MKVSVAQLGARRGYAVPLQLERMGLLHTLYTDTYGGSFPVDLLASLPCALLPAALRRLAARTAELPRAKVRAFHLFGLRYAWRLRRAASRADSLKASLWAGEQFGRLIIRAGLDGSDCLYGLNSASEALFRHARAEGMRTVLDQTSVPAEVEFQIRAEEARRWAEWEGPERWHDGVELFAQRERSEWDLADRIICGSPFVRSALCRCGVERAKCVVVPGVVDCRRFGTAAGRRRRPHSPLRVLFVGKASIHKGLPYFLQALRTLGGRAAVGRVVGPLLCDARVLSAFRPDNVEVVGPVPRSAVPDHYRWADAFCLPTACEGSATVVYEALAGGLPVVTTPNAGSIVRDGLEGFIVPIRAPEAIAEKLEQLRADPALWRRMAQAALQRSAYGSLHAYGRRLAQAIWDGEAPV